ncbi:hypothetical protein STCU_02371 [Strigomonas culicis]|uniref:Uncharacterized protein n=1 Tax=Strigomonas culicis TaxID=28005 RepID=S9UPT2_9TRYP|nr:hypothetical protein STCU_07317 [Strigomonas culicis]EPY30898.1 hypothetical protein STCU_03805 [Strigomonas culicis]EPY33257.1 hypothetical protein STCU_02371 [Strigomonas culicis]|eukprot:EPY24160.1 hypothetical protein STCU_07317 [Strigomonas culicis]
MVLFSTYRSARLVDKAFLMSPVMRMRAFADYHFQRAWNGTLMFVIPGDYRMWAVYIPIIYFMHRWQSEHALEIDLVEKSLINRWGGSVEAVRKNLSPQDQLRARSFTDIEKLYSAYGPKDVNIQPAGDTLPGKDLYKQAGGHGHH